MVATKRIAKKPPVGSKYPCSLMRFPVRQADSLRYGSCANKITFSCNGLQIPLVAHQMPDFVASSKWAVNEGQQILVEHDPGCRRPSVPHEDRKFRGNLAPNKFLYRGGPNTAQDEQWHHHTSSVKSLLP